MGYTFTPITDPTAPIKVPFYENATKETAPYYSSTRTIDAAKAEVLQHLHVLNAVGTFQEGDFNVNGQKRRGYVLEFTLNERRGRMVVAGLPIAAPTPNKLERVRVQALLNLADWLKNAITTQIFSPGLNPLIPFMPVDETHTVADMVNGGEASLLLPAPKPQAIKVEISS